MDPSLNSNTIVADNTQTSPLSGAHKRTYQACIPCRKRKVRCDLGPVDNPHEPPCQRCRRESKECYFSATRRKRRLSSGEDDLRDGDDLGEEPASYNVRRKSARGSVTVPFQGGQATQATTQDAARPTQSGSVSAGSPLDGYHYNLPGSQRPSSQYSIVQSPTGRVEDGQDPELTNEAAAALFQSPINTPGDALHLLLQASGQSEDIQRHGITNQSATRETPHAQTYPPITEKSQSIRPGTTQQVSQSNLVGSIDPAIATNGAGNSRVDFTHEDLAVWSRLRFVRSGWFTAKEAKAYVDYFYQYVAPLTPVLTPDLRDLRENPEILSDEPMLTVTILTIASRYMQVSGPGARTRSYMIHERLWLALQNMITRMFWGQEQYGGRLFNTGSRKWGSRPTDKGVLRALGTIESLLLLSDFHPRSMHFPPVGEDDELMAPHLDKAAGSMDELDAPSEGNNILSGWTESALRSDRMTWSLIGLSHALAYELGIFGNYTDGLQIVDGRVKRQGGLLRSQKRADRIERLLYIYITQACGRFGFPSLFPDHVNKFQIATILDRNYSSVDSLIFESQSPGDVIQDHWVEMAAINKECNDSLFPSKDLTTRFIQTGEYEKRLQKLQQLIQRWQERFAKSQVAKYPRLLLLIDLHYFRLYINGIALQAVLEKWTHKVGAAQEENDPQTPGSTSSASFANMYSRNQGYIKEVVDASRIILRYVVYDLLPNDYLKHAPVRVYFRIVSAAMFLLKTFALGAKQDEVRSSLDLLDGTIKAFRTSVVDDVHLCLRVSDLLEGLTSSIRNKFVRLPPQSPINPPTVKSASQTPQPRYNPTMQQTGFGDQFYQGAGALNPLEGVPQSHTDPNDSNITIMPPPGGSYTNFDFGTTTTNTQQQYPHHQNAQRQQQHQQQQQQQRQQQHQRQHQQHQPNAFPGDPNSHTTSLPFPSENDWLTLDLQPLIDTTGLEADNSAWYGTFGPETHNNLEVLGKLVNEQWQPSDLGF